MAPVNFKGVSNSLDGSFHICLVIAEGLQAEQHRLWTKALNSTARRERCVGFHHLLEQRAGTAAGPAREFAL